MKDLSAAIEIKKENKTTNKTIPAKTIKRPYIQKINQCTNKAYSKTNTTKHPSLMVKKTTYNTKTKQDESVEKHDIQIKPKFYKLELLGELVV